MSTVLGVNAKLKYKVGGVAGGGSWLELTVAQDVTLNLEAGEADISSRGGGGWKATAAALRDASVDFNLLWITADPGFTALKNAYLSGVVIGLQVLDQENGEGLQADFVITKMTRNEPLNEALTVAMTAKVSYVATAPSWIGA